MKSAGKKKKKKGGEESILILGIDKEIGKKKKKKTFCKKDMDKKGKWLKRSCFFFIYHPKNS